MTGIGWQIFICGAFFCAVQETPAQFSKASSSSGALQRVEDSFLFQPTPASKSWLPPPAHVQVQDVWLTAKDGNRIHAWWLPCRGATGAVLFCHGNAGNLSHRGPAVYEFMKRLQESVLIFDYPGYGRSTGAPSETGCYAAADAAYDWLVEEQRISSSEIVLFGESLGGGVATDVASRRTHRALVLVKTFTSLPEMARRSFWTWSSSPLVSHRFDNLEKIGRCSGPVFIAHGDADRLIPLAQAHKLHEAANEPKRFLLLKGAGHNEPPPPDFFVSLESFLTEKGSVRVPR